MQYFKPTESNLTGSVNEQMLYEYKITKIHIAIGCPYRLNCSTFVYKICSGMMIDIRIGMLCEDTNICTTVVPSSWTTTQHSSHNTECNKGDNSRTGTHSCSWLATFSACVEKQQIMPHTIFSTSCRPHVNQGNQNTANFMLIPTGLHKHIVYISNSYISGYPWLPDSWDQQTTTEHKASM